MSPSSQTTGSEQQPEALSDERLAEIEQREAAATPGPWGTYEAGGGGRIDIAADMEHTGYGYRCRREIARLDEEPIDNDRSHDHWDEDDDWSQVHHDAEFVAHARSDVPALVAEVKRLKAALRDACDHIAEQDSEIGAQSIRANAAEQTTRDQIAADFTKFGERQDRLSWGEAVLIAREGLCRCRGGNKPCQDGGAS